MNEPLILAFAMLVGSMLGAFFFGGLWWTIRLALASKQPALWFFGSMLLRTSVVLLGFYFILGNNWQDNWQRLLAGLLGFIVARLIVTRLTRSAAEVGHAP